MDIKEEYLGYLLKIVSNRLDLESRNFSVFKYAKPFEFYLDEDGEETLLLSASLLLESCNTQIDEDDLFENEEDLMQELDIILDDRAIDLVASELGKQFPKVLFMSKRYM